MNAQELFTLAPFGAYVKFTDGTPRPPDRFNKKLRAWKDSNDAGYFMSAEPSDGVHDYSKDSFVLRTLDDPVLIINRHFGVAGSNKTFEVVSMPKPGTILAMNKYRKERHEVAHIWPTLGHAKAWSIGRNHHYEFDKQSYVYFIVQEDGTLKAATTVTATEIAL
jgi:hypothetical protein